MRDGRPRQLLCQHAERDGTQRERDPEYGTLPTPSQPTPSYSSCLTPSHPIPGHSPPLLPQLVQNDQAALAALQPPVKTDGDLSAISMPASAIIAAPMEANQCYGLESSTQVQL